MEKVFEIYIKTTPERLWEAITDPELRAKYSFGVGERARTGRPAPATRRSPRAPASTIAEGENLEVDPPRRLVQSFNALWSDDVKAEGTSRVTWEIEPVGGLVPPDGHARPAAGGRQRRALRRLADDPLRPEDPAGDRRAADDARLAAMPRSEVQRGGTARPSRFPPSPSPTAPAARTRCCGRCGSGGSSLLSGWRGRSPTRCEEHTACPVKGGIASLKRKFAPAAAARPLVTSRSRSAVWLRRVISVPLKNVPGLQSTPMNRRG